jgi:acyl-CoA thioesterase-1
MTFDIPQKTAPGDAEGRAPKASRYRGRRGFLQAGALLLVGLFASGARLARAEPGPQESPKQVKLVALGDSLTAGIFLPAKGAFPAVLEAALRKEGYHVSIVNAGVSGDTASGGLARLDWSLGDGADGLILELGANDMLRGLNPETTRTSLDSILARLKEKNVKVLIAGMLASPSLGRSYRDEFDAIYPDLAAKYGALLYPFFLEGVSGHPQFTLTDGLHPNAAGVETIVNNILPSVRLLLASLGDKPSGN